MPDGQTAQAIQSWYEALGELEARLAGLATPGDTAARADWLPPTDAGPIPAELVTRARTLLVAQERVALELNGALANAAKHLTALRSIPSGTARGTSVYLDVTG